MQVVQEPEFMSINGIAEKHKLCPTSMLMKMLQPKKLNQDFLHLQTI